MLRIGVRQIGGNKYPAIKEWAVKCQVASPRSVSEKNVIGMAVFGIQKPESVYRLS